MDLIYKASLGGSGRMVDSKASCVRAIRAEISFNLLTGNVFHSELRG